MSVIGQDDPELAKHRITLTREGRVLATTPARDHDCRWCGDSSSSRYARADLDLLPLRAPATPNPARRSILDRLLPVVLTSRQKTPRT
jgi:hypothetical protein